LFLTLFSGNSFEMIHWYLQWNGLLAAPHHFCWRKCVVTTLKKDYSVQYLNQWYNFMNCSHPSIHNWVYSLLLGPGHFFSFVILYTVSRTPWMGDQPVARPLSMYRSSQTQNKRTQISMPQVGFEPMNPMFMQAKTVQALDRTASVIGL
jgi:hypothetical protein